MSEERLMSVAEARERILQRVAPTGSESVGIDAVAGRVLAERIVAAEPVPSFANSGMDGFAVRAADVHAAVPESPVGLRVIADISAGAVPEVTVTPGTAARIMTGARVPDGADAVVPLESTDAWPRAANAALPGRVLVRRGVTTGEYVRPAGQDIRPGDVVLKPGRALRAADVGVLVELGYTHARVLRRPRVAVLATGDELVEVGQPLGPAQIRNSNSYTIAALVREAWADPVMLGIARDDEADVRARLRAGLEEGADLFVTSAGVSVGVHDVVRTAVEAEGALDFWRVNVRPGKPLAFGRVGRVPFVGLPGNPVSAVMTFELFVRPALLKMGGRSGGDRPRVTAVLDSPVTSDGRESYLRAVVRRAGGAYHAVLTGDQGSAVLTSLVKANALLIVPAGVRAAALGTTLEALLLVDEAQVE